MGAYSTAARISVGLACVTLTALFLSYLLGLLPDSYRATQQGRASLAEAVAIGSSVAAQQGDVAMVKYLLSALMQRNAQVLSAALRAPDGKLLAEVGSHRAHWQPAKAGDASLSAARFTLYRGAAPWGDIELRFAPVGNVPAYLQALGAIDVTVYQIARAILFVGVLGFFGYLVYMRRILKQLDPSRVIPERVQQLLDTLSEAALILNNDGDIVLANHSFGKILDVPPDKLLGVNASRFHWLRVDDAVPPAGAANAAAAPMLPWDKVIRQDQAAQRNIGLRLEGVAGGTRSFNVNATPIAGHDGKPRGVMVTFDDMTALARKNRRLRKMLRLLKKSQEAVKAQNRQLHALATRDPLTGCLNRRAFLEAFSAAWSAAQRHQRALGLIMVDVDHFKAINDNHGHAQGDEVLEGVAEILKSTCRDGDHVCRYGGEEFCILISSEGIGESVAAAERYRQAVAAAPIAGVSLSVSVGVATYGSGAENPSALIDQADQALYAAKRGGRNRVVPWSEVPAVA